MGLEITSKKQFLRKIKKYFSKKKSERNL